MPFENATETAKRDLLKIYIDKFKAAGNVYLDDPVTDLVMPINDMFFGTPNVVGLVHAHLEWRSFFADALPEGDGPLIATLHDLCSDMYSYRVTGPNVEFLGRGGHHELADPEHSYKVGFEGFNKVFQTNPEDQADGECFYMFHFHSEYTHQDQYLSHDPWLFALIVGCAFVFTSIIFIAYDCAVKRNQNKVMDSAVKSGAIVSALFPEAVRDRMYSEKPGKIHPKANDIRKFHRPDDPAVVELHPQSEDPVADLYPECTVLFADVVGFTAWASEKSPVEVFKFLETIYGHFDKIARQRGVFKVETIGDCYLAVSGLPKPQADHAVVMAKFAYGCHTCMSQLIPELVPVLGSSTAALKIRVGIHSGPVTAGVLRGDRARFQLFGDTVNTAARMESTGLPGRIHVSEQTAKLLVHTGHGNWVSKRTDLVEAKGKGMLQTYWISRGATSDAVRSERSGGVGSSETTTEDSEAEDARQKSIRMHTSIKDTYGKFS
jgi:class 3 adenylate cyclase